MRVSSLCLPDNASWACLLAGPTSCTFCRINMGTEILYGNCTVRTGFLTLLTANATNLTGRHYLFAFIMGTAVHSHFLIVWNQFDQMSWTFCHTFTTGFTCLFIYHCNAIYNMNGMKWTGFHAASKTTAAIGTGFCATIWNKGKHLTVFHSSVNVLFLRLFCVLVDAPVLLQIRVSDSKYDGYLVV